MKLTKIFWARMIPVIIIIVVTWILSVMVYRQMVVVEEETCWERLRIATESTAGKIEIRINDNINFLEAVSDSYILKNHIHHEQEVGNYLTSVVSRTIFESIDVILPDKVITQHGEIAAATYDISYDELVKFGKHISPRRYDEVIGGEVVYCFIPIDSDGETIGMLCGKLVCETLSKIFEVFTYKGDAQLFLIDCTDGNYIIDNWHNTLGNIYELGNRKGLDGEAIDMISPIINRETGRMAYISATNGENSYQYYTPVKGYNWELCVAVQEDVIFANLNNLRNYLYYVGMVEGVIILVFLFWNIYITISAAKSEAKAKQLELTRATNEAKARFISNMSHDIRTPLNGIVGMLHIIKKHRNDQPMVDDCLEKIEISTHYLATLASDMLDINEIESDKLVLENNPIDLYKLADELSVMIEPKAREAKVEYIIDYSGIKNPYVLGSNVHIQRVLVNLIGNAVKYSKRINGNVWVNFDEIESHEDYGVYRFTVKDNGIGMSEEFQHNMYNAFAQERQDARSSYEGYGLGLTIVYRLVEKMNGKIDIHSEKNVGSTFKITIPFKYDTSERKPVQEQETEADLKGAHVLLVEDNEFNKEIAEVILTDAGAEVTSAMNGKVAVEIFKKSENSYFDLILMDIMMPEMDGCEATKVIRALDREDAKTVAVFAMTAHTFADEIKRCREAGMNEHIGKPLDVSRLMSLAAKYCKKN